MRDAAGNYPGPDTLGRQAFEYSGNRNEYDGNFGTEEVKAFVAATLAGLEGVGPGRAVGEFDALTNGPLLVSVTMPLTDGNVAAVVAAREAAAMFGCGGLRREGTIIGLERRLMRSMCMIRSIGRTRIRRFWVFIRGCLEQAMGRSWQLRRVVLLMRGMLVEEVKLL